MITNDTIAFKQGFGEYLGRWFDGFQPNTAAAQSFKERGFSASVKWAAGRMVDDALAMLESYRKNENTGIVNASSKIPVVLAAVARDYTPTTGDWIGRQTPREMVRITDEEDASVYGYRQAAHDLRVQLAFFAVEDATARNLVGEFCWFLAQPGNRSFPMPFKWGQYDVETFAMIESPDIIVTNASGEQKNLVILTCDITVKVTVPYLDAPTDPEEMDGSGRDPEGYLVVEQVEISSVKNRNPFNSKIISGKSVMTVNDTGMTNEEIR